MSVARKVEVESRYLAGEADMDLVLMKAWEMFPGPAQSSQRYGYVVDQISDDKTYALMFAHSPVALGDAIKAGLRRIQGLFNTGTKPVGGGQVSVGAQHGDAPANSLSVPANAGGGGHRRDGDQSKSAPTGNGVSPFGPHRSGPARGTTPSMINPPAAPTKPVLPARPSLKELADRQSDATGGRIKLTQRYSKLDDVWVRLDGVEKRIGDCTVGEVKAWITIRTQDAREASRDVRFAKALVYHNLPSNRIVRDVWRNLDEVDRMYANATTEAQSAA